MYWLFAGDQYYPMGGMDDLVSKSEDLEILIALAKDGDPARNGDTEYDWWHIADSDGTVVERSW